MHPDQQFGKLLKRVYHLWHQVINERLRESDVSHSQWRVVLEVSRSAAPMTQAALAAELGVESPTMVRLLDRLAEKGWIAREPCPDDRRARYVRLTPRAQRLAEELEVVVGDVRRELLQDLRVAELAASIDALAKVERRASAAIAGGRERTSTEPSAGGDTGAGRNGAARSSRSRANGARSAGAKSRSRRPSASTRPTV